MTTTTTTTKTATRSRSTPAATNSTSWLHPRVHVLLVAVAAWFALAVWSFAGPGIVDYLLFIVSGFIVVAVGLPLILACVGRTPRAAMVKENTPSLREWARSEYETSEGSLPGAEAATQIVLPIAAAAVGMTAIGLIFYFSAPAGA